MKIFLFIIALLSISLTVKSSPTDSLKNLIKSTADIEKKIDLFLEISDYYLLGEKEKDDAVNSAYNLALKSDNKEKIALTSFYKASAYNFYSEYDSAVILLTKAIEIFTDLNDTLLLAATWGEKGNAFCYRALYDKCLDCFLKSLQYTEELGNPRYLGTVLNNIGNVYYYMDKDDEALIYYQKALRIYKKSSFEYGIALSSNNIGSYFLDNRQFDSALYYLQISEKYAIGIDYFEQLAETTANMAKLFHEENNYTKAKLYSLKSISLFKKINSDYGLTKGYLGYGQLLFEQKQDDLSRKYVDSSFFTATNAGVTEYVKEAYYWRYKLDSASGDYKSALSNYLSYIELKDSLKSQEIEKQIANLQAVFDLDKKEKENLLLKEQKSKQEIIIQRQRIITIFTLVALLLFIGFLIVLYFFYKNQKKHNHQLELKNEEILQQKEEIITQNEILTEKNKEIEEQSVILRKYKKNTTDSINYAKRIQSSSLPNLQNIHNLFTDSMLIYLPKDIISGDFYFYQKINENKHVIAIADCTGHGIPGAFMSILNISILKEILRESPNSTSAQILERARELIKSTLKQNINNQLINDGMDIILLIYNPSDMTINYSGANRDLIYFNKNGLQIIKSNKQPISAYIKERNFVDNNFQGSKDDVFYLFSDGFADQMSEKNFSKYLLKNFKLLLTEIHLLEMNEQKQIILKKLEEHKGSKHQTDDITILGFKI